MQSQVDKLPASVVKKVVEPIAKVIGVPSAWFTYGYPPYVDWLRIEQVYREYPMVTYAADQFAEQCIGPGFYLQAASGDDIDPDEAQIVKTICDKFDESHHSKRHMIRIARELYIYGNSPLERRFTSIQKDPDDQYKVSQLGEFAAIQPLPISTMRIVPDMFTGADPARGYVQIIQGQYIKLAPEQVAWFRMNETSGNIGDEFYGQGAVQCVLDYVWALERMERDGVAVVHRYAAPKVLWQLGSEKDPAPQEKLTDWSNTIAGVAADQDYVGTHLTDAKLLVPNTNNRFAEILGHFRSMVVAGLQNPNLMLVMLPARVSDASANAMQEAWTRKISAAQDAIKELWEDVIYKPLVIQAGYNEAYTPELIYGSPAEEDPDKEIQELISLLNPTTVQISPRSRLEFENMLRQQKGLEPLNVENELAKQQAAPPQPPLPSRDEELHTGLQDVRKRVTSLEKPPQQFSQGIGYGNKDDDEDQEPAQPAAPSGKKKAKSTGG
jgi:hypothetical protein